LTWCNYKTKILNIVLLGNTLKTKIHPCGRTYIYIDMPSGEALPPCLTYILPRRWIVGGTTDMNALTIVHWIGKIKDLLNKIGTTFV